MDAVYDISSGVYAVLVAQSGKNNVFVKQITGASGTPPSNTISDVGNVRIALGQLDTSPAPSTGPSPHLFLMQRDAAKLRTIRLSRATLHKDVLDNTIILKNTIAGVYVPSGAKETCCNGAKEWVAASSDDGFVYYLAAKDLRLNEAFVFSPNLSLSKLASGRALSGLMQIVGGDIALLHGAEAPISFSVCNRQVFYAFSPGYVAATCEGDTSGATLVVSRDNFEGA
jgi:hypothetical protein